MRFNKLKDALGEYKDQTSYGANPILAKTIRVIRTPEEIEKELEDDN